MGRSRGIMAFVVGGILLLPGAPGFAADGGVGQGVARPEGLPFARSERAASVWAGGACWSECGAYCAWGLVACLGREAQGRCLKLTDRCDRYCQRECRSSGGPLLPLAD